MKKQVTFFCKALALAVVLPSCQLIDTDKEHKPHGNIKIAEINYYSDSTDVYIPKGQYDRNIYFNAKGEPTRSIAVNPTTGNAHQAFVYSDKGLLKQWLYHFGSEPSSVYAEPQYNNGFVAHLYDHDKKGNIIADTLFILNGQPINGGATRYSLTKYTYDAKGRVLSADEHLLLGGNDVPYSVSKFIYSALDNLAVYTYSRDYYGHYSFEEKYTYDDKKSAIGSSKVLSFLNRNYSVNNVATVSHEDTDGKNYVKAYANGYDLVGRLVSADTLLLPFEGYSRGVSKIKYQ